MARSNGISRDAILDAAEQIIAKNGAGRMTLEAVAARAKVSKGGLQYVFKTKDALIQAMIQRFIDLGEQEYDVEREKVADRSHNLQAFVRAGLANDIEVQPVHTALVAAAASNPKLLAPVQDLLHEKWEQLAQDTGLPFARIAAVALAADALMLYEVIGVKPLDAEHRQILLDELLRLAEPPAS